MVDPMYIYPTAGRSVAKYRICQESTYYYRTLIHRSNQNIATRTHQCARHRCHHSTANLEENCYTRLVLLRYSMDSINCTYLPFMNFDAKLLQLSSLVNSHTARTKTRESNDANMESTDAIHYYPV